MTSLSTDRLLEKADEYERMEPFYTVESNRLDTMPAAFAEGSFVWKDAEWVVRWFCRRQLDGAVHPAEATFRENDGVAVREAIHEAVEAARVDEPAEAVRWLTTLDGVDVPIASAFLQYVDPASYPVLDEPLWDALRTHGELDEPYPESVEVSDYVRYLETCRAIANDRGVDLPTLSRALWRLAPNRTTNP